MEISVSKKQQDQVKKSQRSQTLNDQANTQTTAEDILRYYSRVRHDSDYLCEPLEIDD